MFNSDNTDILIMTDNSIETVGGEQISTKIILEGIKDYSQVGLIQPGNLLFHDPNINYYELSKDNRLKTIIKNPISFLKYINNVKKIINKTNPKILHTQSQVSFFIVSLLKKMKQIPKSQMLIHTERGLYTKYNRFFKSIFFFFMKELNVLVTTTNFNKKYWKKALTDKDISLEYKVIENTAGEIYEVLDENKLSNNKEYFSVGFSGRYTDWKNWPLAVEISEQLNDSIGDKLRINMTIGCLDEKSEIETKKMFDYLNDLLGDRFTGKINVNENEMDQFYYDLDVFILTSKKNTESFGRTLVEAMSRYTAVLTTDAGGAVEVVGDLNNVYNTPEAFTDKIMSYIRNPKILETEKSQNLTRVHEKYSLSNNLEKHFKLYSKIVKKRN